MNKAAKILLILSLILMPVGLGCSEDAETDPPSEVENPAERTPDTMTERSRGSGDRGSGRRTRAGRPSRAGAEAETSTLLPRLPDNVLFFVTTGGGDTLKNDFDSSILGQIWRDPGMQNFYRSIKDAVLASVEQQMPPEQAGIFPGVKQLAGPMLKRPIIFGAAQPEPSAELPVYGFLLVDAGSGREEITQTVSDMEATFPEGSIVDHIVGSYTFHTWRQGAAPAYWGWAENYFVFAVGDVQGLVVENLTRQRSTGGSTILQAYQKVPGANDAVALAVDFQKVRNLLNMFLLQEDPAAAGQITSVLELLGLNQVQSYITRLGISDSGMTKNACLEVPRPYTGLWKCLHPIDMAQLDQVDASAVSAGVLNVDPAELFDTIMNTLQKAAPPQTFEMAQQELAAFEQQMGFKIRAELLASLAGPVLYYSLPPEAPPNAAMNQQAGMMGPAGSAPRFVMTAQLKDPALMQKSLAALIRFAQTAGAQAGIQFSTQQIQGQTVHTLVFLPLAMMQVTPCLTIMDDQLIFTANAEDCQAVLKRLLSTDSSQKSIRTTADFQRVTANLPDNLLSFSYTDSKTQFKQITTLLQQSWPMLTLMAQQSQINLPMEMPALDQYAEQMGSTCSYSWFDDAGIRSQAEGPGVALNAAAVVGGGAFGLSIAMPALIQARNQAKQIVCMQKLQNIGTTIKNYSDDHQGKTPPALDTLFETGYLTDKEILTCPLSDDLPGQNSFIYRAYDVDLQVVNNYEGMIVYKGVGNYPKGVLILAYDKYENHKGQSRNLVFADTHCVNIPESEFQSAIDWDNQARRKFGLPERPADVEKTVVIEKSKPLETMTVLPKESTSASDAAAKLLDCSVRLQAVGEAIINYQKNFRGFNPTLLQDLTMIAKLPPENLICPAAGDQPGSCSYIYRGSDLNSSAAPEMILAYDKSGVHGDLRNVLFADATVKKLTESEFQQAIVQDNELRRKKGLPEKPADRKDVL